MDFACDSRAAFKGKVPENTHRLKAESLVETGIEVIPWLAVSSVVAVDRDGYPFWPFWDNVRSWWAVRDLPNVKFIDFANLKHDMAREIRAIATFLDIPIKESRWESILEHCSFEWMKKNATKSVPLGGAFWDAGAEVFINKGVNGRWTDTLTPEEVAEYEARSRTELNDECAHWLAMSK